MTSLSVCSTPLPLANIIFANNSQIVFQYDGPGYTTQLCEVEFASVARGYGNAGFALTIAHGASANEFSG